MSHALKAAEQLHQIGMLYLGIKDRPIPIERAVGIIEQCIQDAIAEAEFVPDRPHSGGYAPAGLRWVSRAEYNQALAEIDRLRGHIADMGTQREPDRKQLLGRIAELEEVGAAAERAYASRNNDCVRIEQRIAELEKSTARTSAKSGELYTALLVGLLKRVPHHGPQGSYSKAEGHCWPDCVACEFEKIE